VYPFVKENVARENHPFENDLLLENDVFISIFAERQDCSIFPGSGG
jgi:hypothetical protein